MRTNSRTGVSTVGLVVGLVVLAAIVFGGVYLYSDVFRTKANAAMDQFAHWTPENIAKDPVNYLNFCEEQTKAAVTKLKASEIAIAQKKASIQTMVDDAKSKVAGGKVALDELKAIYVKADADKKWPATWRTQTLEQEPCKRQILKFDREIRGKEDLLKKLDSAVAQLNVQSNQVQEARDKAGDQLAKITTSREMLKVQQITDDLKNNLVAMKGIIETSVVGVASGETGAISLDDLAKQSAATVDEGEFNKVMGGK
jgi:hypothetical protein